MPFTKLIPNNWNIKHYLNQDTGHEKQIVLRHGHIAITNYDLGDCPELEKSLSVWNEMYYRYEVVGYYYVKKCRELRLNRNYNLARLCKLFPNAKPRIDQDHFKSDVVDIKLYAEPRDDIQKLCITFIAGAGKYAYTNSYTQKFIRLRPGSGKTYSLCAASAFFSARTVVIMPMSVLIQQWIDSYVEFTSIKKEEILVVQGSKKCEEIRNGKHKNKKIFLFIIDTLVSYHDRYGDDLTCEMLEATKAYLLGVDECHLNFKALSEIIALQDFAMTIWLTASPDRTEQKESWIYKTVFHDVPQFGENVFHKDEKYLNVMVKEYRFTPAMNQINAINTKMGLNTKLYEMALLNSDAAAIADFEESLDLMLRWAKSKMKPEHRMLMLANTVEGAQYLTRRCKKVFDESEVGLYYGGMNKEDKKAALPKRVICATASSCGTGFDMPGMTICMNILTYGSKVMATQLSGRVRKPKDGSPAIYVEFVNVGYHKCYNQYRSRKAELAKQVPNGKIIVIQ